MNRQKIVDRIFVGAGHPIICDEPDSIGYDDFVCKIFWENIDFILSEEDKSTISSLSYWFRCIDLGINSVTIR